MSCSIALALAVVVAVVAILDIRQRMEKKNRTLPVGRPSCSPTFHSSLLPSFARTRMPHPDTCRVYMDTLCLPFRLATCGERFDGKDHFRNVGLMRQVGKCTLH